MNVIVVDDEPIIRVGLRTLVDWEQFGFTLIGEAEDGNEALELIQNHRVDLVITDLLMPRMDGLELMRKLKEQSADLSVIVLSCMDDFNWVKEAMKLGAKDYILKPTMEPEQLMEIVLGARRELEQLRDERHRMESWQLEREQTKQAKLAMKLQGYLQQGRGEQGLEDELFENGQALFSLMIHGLPELGVHSDEWRAFGSKAALPLGMGRLLLLYQGVATGEAVDGCWDEAIIAQAAYCSNYLEQTPQLADKTDNWFIGVGIRMTSLTELTESLEWHKRQWQHRFYSSSTDRIIFQSLHLPAISPLPYDGMNDLLRALAQSNIVGFHSQAVELVQRLRENPYPVEEVMKFAGEVLKQALVCAGELGMPAEELENKFGLPDSLYRCYSIEPLCSYLMEALEGIGSSLSGSASGSLMLPKHPFIRKAVQFIKENYSKSISTSDVAEHVRLSRSYLSDLYSREMGESLSESLTRIRMEEAKRLLRSSERKVYEIAEAVGFPDAKSFTKAFKRIVGCAPTEYERPNK
jgi:two-component system response regulator YesN